MRTLHRTTALITAMAAAMIGVGAANAQTVVPKHDGEEDPIVRVVALTAEVGATDGRANEQHFSLQCPVSYVPTRYSITAPNTDGFMAQTGAQLIGMQKFPIDKAALDRAADAYPILNGAGYDIAFTVDEGRRGTRRIEIALWCVAYAAATDFKLMLVKSETMAAAASYSTATAWCPANNPVAISGFSISDARNLEDAGSAPAWGTSSNPIRLRDITTDQTGAPTGWQSKVFNRRSEPVELVAYALCGRAPGVRSFIYSTPTLAGDAYSVFASVPEPSHFVGAGADHGEHGIDTGFDAWIRYGPVVNLLVWQNTTTVYDSNVYSVRAFIAEGVDGRNKSSSAQQPEGRAVAAVLAIPELDSPPPSYPVTIFEFYSAALDHYFITADSNEIRDLDTGVHAGWARTGQSFRAYGFGSGGRLGRRPVCRLYGKPEAGLDSHFYSASSDECAAALANSSGAWGLESSEVFQMMLPDSSGACAAGFVPVYRTWNQRTDSNHRYTTSMAMRDEMIAKGHVAEGYGSNAVALCALL